MTVAPTPLRAPSVSARVARLHHGERADQWLWLGGGALFAFLVPFLFADVIGVSRDLYYAIYSLSVFALFAAWMRASHENVRAFFAHNWKWAVALGLIAGGVLAAIVFKDTRSAHPNGATSGAEIIWRGVVYGAADGILLGTFPILAVFAAIPYKRGREHLLGTLGTGVLALAMAFGFTAVYHAGYSEFRSGKIGTPVRGTAIWGAPTLLTLNPLGAPIAHIAMHVSAVIRQTTRPTRSCRHTDSKGGRRDHERRPDPCGREFGLHRVLAF